jgi:hypothetical protein
MNVHKVLCLVTKAIRWIACAASSTLSLQPCRQKETQPLLGFLWQAIPSLLFVRLSRIATNAADCLGVLIAAIFMAGGATVAVPNPFLSDADHKDTPEKSRKRSSKSSSKNSKNSKKRQGTWPAENVPGSSAKRMETVPAHVGVTWAAQLLAGGPCSVTAAHISDAEQRELLLAVLRKALTATEAEMRPALAQQLLVALLQLLDADSTTVVELGGYLRTLLLAVDAATAADVSRHLADMLDSFLGWSLEVSCSQEDRYSSVTLRVLWM